VIGSRALRAAGLALAFAGLACRGVAPRPEPGGSAADRERVLAFWDTFQAATAHRTAGDCRGAAPLYEKALAGDPRHEDSLYYLAQCQRELGRPAEARRTFERLVGLNPASSRGHLALGALLASPDVREPPDLAAAEAAFRRAHAINGDETGPMVRLAEVLIVVGRVDEAAHWAEAAVRTNPKAVDAALLAVYLARERGDQAAIRTFSALARQAVRVEAPVKGVLNEGDRRSGPAAAVAPPLENPMGRLLFTEVLSEARAQAAAAAPDVEGLRRAVSRERARHARRARG
jgi:tetratricopeptide (TPR) repeat protein